MKIIEALGSGRLFAVCLNPALHDRSIRNDSILIDNDDAIMD